MDGLLLLMERCVQKLLTGFAAASALVLFASAAQAQCSGNHNVTASTETEQIVTMSTYDGPLVPPSIPEVQELAKAAAVCAEGEKDCAAGTKQVAGH